MSRKTETLAKQLESHHTYWWKCPECSEYFNQVNGTKITFIKRLLKEEVREINGIFICNWCASKHEKQ